MSDRVFDLVVIGGGVTGTGAALDAASRGLEVALVEQRDYGSGTSSRSSKLFHGGLRYLEQLEFGLVREALTERNLMLTTIAPHLARPVSFVYPLVHRFWERLYVGAGVLLYEALARGAGNPLPRHRHLSREELLELAPALDPSRIYGAVRYWDALVDDARHTVTVARTAAAHGARLASSTRVVGLDTGSGSIRTVLALDLESGREVEIRTRSVINAAGVWSGDMQRLAGGEGLEVTASKGIHLVVPRDRIASQTGIILRTRVSVLFVIPWGDHWIVGTTDTPWALRRAHPAASRSDLDYLLRWVSTVLATPITHSDIVGVYAGLRPLLSGESEETSKLSREHAVLDRGDGMVTVAGGKYTTYRVMARDAVDATAPYLDRPLPPSRTHRIPLVGALGRERLTRPDAIEEAQWRRLLGRYGALAGDLAELISEQPDLGETVVGDSPYLRAEIVYAATHEGALHLDDALTRRTRMSVETRHRGLDAVAETARLMGDALGWPEETREREMEHYRARVAAEIDSQRQPDDRTADAARMGAPDVRTGVAE
ncbi:MAG: glycerol-3-phosphate dehydrogenase/oxidase [Actinobacteria bacterium]|nr:glycerol-3-phosphate dehydrogenase/oxidase [Actinomycetota bacterium]